MNREERNQENVNHEYVKRETETLSQEVTNQGRSNQKEMMEEDKNSDMMNLTTDRTKKALQDDRNAKERLYDKIPISLKALDVFIGVLIGVFVLIMLYFIIRRFS